MWLVIALKQATKTKIGMVERPIWTQILQINYSKSCWSKNGKEGHKSDQPTNRTKPATSKSKHHQTRLQTGPNQSPP